MTTQSTATQAPASLTQSRKHAIFFIIVVKAVLNMQSLTKQLKSLRSEMRIQREKVNGFIPNPSEVFEQYVKILSNVSGVEKNEMTLFLKEYLKDHLRKKVKEQVLPQEKVEEILYETYQKVLTLKGIQSVLSVTEDAKRSIEKVDRGEKKIFQSQESAKIQVLIDVMEKFLSEISGISGYSQEELSETQYTVLVAIVDGL